MWWQTRGWRLTRCRRLATPDCVRSAVRVRCEWRFGWQHFSCLPSRTTKVWRVLHHLSVAFCVRYVCAVLASSTRRSGFAFDGGVLCWPAPPPIVRVSLSKGQLRLPPVVRSHVRWVCCSHLPFDGCVATITSRSRLAFGEVVSRWTPPSLVVRVSRPTGECWLPPTPVVRISRSMAVC